MKGSARASGNAVVRVHAAWNAHDGRRFGPAGDKDSSGNSARRGELAARLLGDAVERMRGGLRGRCWRRRRHGSFHQEGNRLARQSLGIEKRDQNNGKQNGAVECKGCNHPAAAAGADSAGGFKGGVFKHGLPPEVRFSRAGWAPGGLPQTRGGRPLHALSGAATWLSQAAIPARGAELKALRSSQSEPLCWCRHRPRTNCSRGRQNRRWLVYTPEHKNLGVFGRIKSGFS